jgi:hypothetical protein
MILKQVDYLPFASTLVAVGQSSLDGEWFSCLVESLLVQLVQVDLLVARLRNSLVDVGHLKIGINSIKVM